MASLSQVCFIEYNMICKKPERPLSVCRWLQLIFMERAKKQERIRDGFRDAKSEGSKQQLKKWEPGFEIVTREDLKNKGCCSIPDSEDYFLVGKTPQKLEDAIKCGQIDGMSAGQWMRHLNDLVASSTKPVRFTNSSDLLTMFTNVRDKEAALKFANRFGLPSTGFGVFYTNACNFVLPLASVSEIVTEAEFIRTISLLRDIQGGTKIQGVDLAEIHTTLRSFANSNFLNQMSIEDSPRLFSGNGDPKMNIEQLWELAMRIIESILGRLCRAQNIMTSSVVTFNASCTRGALYLQLRSTILDPGPLFKICANPACGLYFRPGRASEKYCCRSCGRQVNDRERTARKSRNQSMYN